MMCLPLLGRFSFFLAPDHGGDAISGGGHPANVPPPASEALAEAFGDDAGGRGQTPDPGVPGSKGFPVGKLLDDIRQRAQEIWEQEGRPEGRAADHWLRAEAEIGQRNA